MPSFADLMALASKQTEASQIALAKETQFREAREKAKRLEEERKEKDRTRLEKERLARQKLDDERREKQLAEERQRRQTERLAAVELARKQQELNLTSQSSSSRVNNRPKPTPRNRSAPHPSTSISTNNPPEDALEKRLRDREEKKARARAKLFDEPISAHRKPPALRPGTKLAQRPKTIVKGASPQRATAIGSKPQTVPGSAPSLTARQQIEKQFTANERKPLNQVKRDRRTIDEIEQDMKRKKALPHAETSALSRKTQDLSLESGRRAPPPLKTTTSTSLSKEAHRSPRVIPESTPTIKRKLSTGSVAPPSKRTLAPNSLPRTTGRAGEFQRSASGSKPQPGSHSHSSKTHKSHVDHSEDEDSSESDEFPDQDAPVAPSIRDEIWKIMGKDRKQYTAKPIDSDEEGSDDMEADIDDVLEEEGRAARLARLEDQREQERLRQHELEKKKRLMQHRLPK